MFDFVESTFNLDRVSRVIRNAFRRLGFVDDGAAVENGVADAAIVIPKFRVNIPEPIAIHLNTDEINEHINPSNTTSMNIDLVRLIGEQQQNNDRQHTNLIDTNILQIINNPDRQEISIPHIDDETFYETETPGVFKKGM